MTSDSQRRKETPLYSGCFTYIPDALEAFARLSYAGNRKHNPGQPLHHARGKSADHADCMLRHLKTYDEIDPETGEYHAVAVFWRAGLFLQEFLEKQNGLPMARGARPAPSKAEKRTKKRGSVSRTRSRRRS